MSRRTLRRAALPVLLLPLAACGAGATMASSVPDGVAAHVPDGDWPTFDYNAQRSGVGPAATGITRRTLSALQERVVTLPGTVDASVIQLHDIRISGRRRDVLVMTTTYGRTLAIDPGSGKLLWQFVPRDIGSYQSGPQITQSTPVADPDRRYVYSLSPDGYAHKLNLANGHALWSTRVTWDATREKVDQLTLAGRWLIVTTGGYDGDAPSYQGHVVEIDRRTGRVAHVWNSLCSHRRSLIHPPSSCGASDSAIWGRAGAVVDPSNGHVLVATGNGPFNGSTNWGDSTLELSPTLRPLRHWTPTNQQQLNQNDTDVGSTSPVLLPGGLAVQGGKAGLLSLLKLSTLPSMTGAGAHHLGGERQDISTPGGAGVFTAPAVWRRSGRTSLFVATDGGVSAYVLGSSGRLRVAWNDGFAGTSPVVAGGLLYVFDEQSGILNILSPATGHVLKALNVAGGHWNSPIVVGGRIILPVGNGDDQQTSGQLYIWHLPGR